MLPHAGVPPTIPPVPHPPPPAPPLLTRRAALALPRTLPRPHSRLHRTPRCRPPHQHPRDAQLWPRACRRALPLRNAARRPFLAGPAQAPYGEEGAAGPARCDQPNGTVGPLARVRTGGGGAVGDRGAAGLACRGRVELAGCGRDRGTSWGRARHRSVAVEPLLQAAYPPLAPLTWRDRRAALLPPRHFASRHARTRTATLAGLWSSQERPRRPLSSARFPSPALGIPAPHDPPPTPSSTAR